VEASGWGGGAKREEEGSRGWELCGRNGALCRLLVGGEVRGSVSLRQRVLGCWEQNNRRGRYRRCILGRRPGRAC